jgi:hypothetical protein
MELFLALVQYPQLVDLFFLPLFKNCSLFVLTFKSIFNIAILIAKLVMLEQVKRYYLVD